MTLLANAIPPADLSAQLCAAYKALLDHSKSTTDYSYIFSIPHQERAWIGCQPERVIRYTANGIELEEKGARKLITHGTDDVFRDIGHYLDPETATFFMVSPDLERKSADPSLPLAVFFQPKTELALDVDSSGISTSPDCPAELAHIFNNLNHTTTEDPPARLNNPTIAAVTDWCSEPDDEFRARLEQAVQTLQNVDGKMIMTRGYSKTLPPAMDYLRLFEIYNNLEPASAASHYLSLPGNINSVGCSPENIFELDHGTLTFDVIASTRGVSADPEEDQRWQQELQNDPKEIREHTMALERYEKRLAGLCKKGSVSRDFHLNVRHLRHVRHLYSKVSGQLKPSMNFLDMIADSFPPLNSYPDELIPQADPDKEPFRFYAGMVGRAGPGWKDASCFLNLRSALACGETLYTLGGVGVIAQSIPKQELLEVKNKLRCLMEAISLWEKDQYAGQ